VHLKRTVAPQSGPTLTAGKSRGRSFVFALLAISLSTVFCVAFAEIVLRFLPVATGMWSMPVDATRPVFRFSPNREFLFSRDWNFSIVNRGHINNDGFVNDGDYQTEDQRPLLAVVGDSYVEAAMVPNRLTFYRRLADGIGARGRVYSFGASGAPLSQYLVWSRYAVEKYRPAGLVILVVGNDFDESLGRYGEKVGMHFYAKTASGRLNLYRVDYHPSLFRRLVRHSALGRYLIFNLQAVEAVKQLSARLGLTSPAFAAAPEYIGNTSAAASAERVRDSYQAISAFLDDLSSVGLPPDRIAFLVEGARYREAVEATEQSYFGLMRAYFKAQASQHGYEVIDLQPWFVKHSDAGARYEFPTDAHWNETGHAVAAEALAGSKLVGALFRAR
jgi:hypothetical protein